MKAVKCDLDKAIINIGFVGAVFTAMILCFTANVYTETSTGKTYSVMEAIFTLDKNIIRSNYELSSLSVFRKCLSGYITMFIPIITAFPYMVTFCAERNSGLMRFTISRTGKIRYCLSKFVSCTVSAGLSIMIGVMLFGVVSAVIFPDISTYDVPSDVMKLIFPQGVLGCTAGIIAASFLYGAISVMPAFFISSFCKNPYIITCLPFWAIYLWNTALDRLQITLVENQDMERLGKLSMFYPHSILSAVMNKVGDNTAGTVLFNSIYVVILLSLFLIIMNCRRDKGV